MEGARREVAEGQGWAEGAGAGAGRMLAIRGREDGVRQVWSARGWMSGVERDRGSMWMM